MIFGELPLTECTGAMLAHAIRIDGRRIAKGTSVDRGLIEAAERAGMHRLWIARLEAGDVPEDLAADRVAEMLAGSGIARRAPSHGRVNLHAAHDGLLLYEPDAVIRANGQCESIGISTMPVHTPVAAGDMLATIKVFPYAIGAAELGSLCQLLHRSLEVRPWQTGISACLIQTALYDTAPKQLAKTAAVTRARLARLGISMVEPPIVAHAVEPLAQALVAANAVAAAQAGLLLISGATATSDRRDVLPAAIVAAGGSVTRFGMPVDPGNLIVMGRLGDAGLVVIGLPGCAKSPKRNGLDLVLERLAAGLPVDSADFDRMGVGGMLDEAGRTVPWAWAAGAA